VKLSLLRRNGYVNQRLHDEPFYLIHDKTIYIAKFGKVKSLMRMNSNSATVMILAAGIGSRLKPLTDLKPKALVNYNGKPMLKRVIDNIVDQGFRRIVINTHHHASQIVEYLKRNDFGSTEVLISDESKMLMDTGGGIIHARSLLDGRGPFIVHNVDILSNIDLIKLLSYHRQYHPVATLVVKKRETSRQLGIDESGNLSGWKNNNSGETISVPSKRITNYTAYSGIQVINPVLFEMVHEQRPFPIIPKYLELAGNNQIKVYDQSDDDWIDMASINHIERLS